MMMFGGMMDLEDWRNRIKEEEREVWLAGSAIPSMHLFIKLLAD